MGKRELASAGDAGDRDRERAAGGQRQEVAPEIGFQFHSLGVAKVYRAESARRLMCAGAMPG